MQNVAASLAMLILFGIHPSRYLNDPGESESPPSTDILCIVRPVGTSETAGPIPVTVSVQNRSKRGLDLFVQPVLELKPSSGSAYWAPFDLQNSQSPRDANSRCFLKLAPGATFEREIRLEKLLSDRVFSSLWPRHPLSSLPAGSYLLTFTIEVVGQEPGRRITSEPITFFVPRRSRLTTLTKQLSGATALVLCTLAVPSQIASSRESSRSIQAGASGWGNHQYSAVVQFYVMSSFGMLSVLVLLASSALALRAAEWGPPQLRGTLCQAVSNEGYMAVCR